MLDDVAAEEPKKLLYLLLNAVVILPYTIWQRKEVAVTASAA